MKSTKNLFYMYLVVTIVSVLMLGTISQTVLAVPVLSEPVTVTQADGTTITIIGFGDEFFKWQETLDGYIIAFCHDTQNWYYATISNDKIIAGTELVGSDTAGKRLTQADIGYIINSVVRDHPAITPPELTNMGVSGFTDEQEPFWLPNIKTVNNRQPLLLLLIEYETQEQDGTRLFTETYAQSLGYSINEYWSNKVFSTQNANFPHGTVNDYYAEVSGEFNLQFETPNFTVPNSYMVEADHYFIENYSAWSSDISSVRIQSGVARVRLNQSHPGPNADFADVRTDTQLAFEAVAPFLDIDSFPRVSDNDSNNNAEYILSQDFNIYSIIAGYEGSSNPNDVKRHSIGNGHAGWQWLQDIDGYNRTYSVRFLPPSSSDRHNRLGTYATNGELSNDTLPTGIGVIVHELGHVLGLPDLYSYHKGDGTPEKEGHGIGFYCGMSSGAHGSPTQSSPSSVMPVHFSAWAKYRLGWVEPIVVDVSEGGIFDVTSICVDHVNCANHNEHGNYEYNVIMVTNTALSKEQYFLIENRQSVGFDRGMDGRTGLTSLTNRGILIYHVDVRPHRLAGHNGYGANNNNAHKTVDLERYRNPNYDAFFRIDDNFNTFNAASVPNSNFHTDGELDSEHLKANRLNLTNQWQHTPSGVDIRIFGEQNSTRYDGGHLHTIPISVASTAQGEGWTLRHTPNSRSRWDALAYGNGTFVALGAMPNMSEFYAMTSPDGISWTSQEPISLSFVPEIWERNLTNGTPYSQVMVFLTYDESRNLFIGGASAYGRTELFHSPDGITWTKVTQEFISSDTIHFDISAGNGMVVVTGGSRTIGTNRPPTILVSQDLITWQAVHAPVELQDEREANPMAWMFLTFGDGRFVASSIWRWFVGYFDNNQNIITSTDGINWDFGTDTFTYSNSIAHGNGLFVAERGNGAIHSTDSYSWSAFSTSTAQDFLSVAHIKDGVFIIVGGEDTVAIEPQRNPTPSFTLPSPDPLNSWSRVASDGNRRVVAISNAGERHQRVMTYDFRWINTKATEGGTVTANRTTAAVGAEVTLSLTATPADGYVFERWSISDNAPLVVGGFSQETTQAPEPRFYTAPVYADEDEEIIQAHDFPIPTQIMPPPIDEQALELSAFDEHIFDEHSLDDHILHGSSTSETLHFVMPNGDVNITAIFRNTNATASPQLLTTAGQNATITPTQGTTVLNSPSTVDTGATVVFTATPDTGYRIASWEITGGTVTDSTPNTRTVTVNSDVFVNVTCEPIPTFLVVFDPNGGSINGDTAYIMEENIIYGASIAPPTDPIRLGYVFGSWDKDLNAITENTIVTAEWLRLGAVSTDGMGDLSSTDVVFLARHLADHAGFGVILPSIADINGDGAVNAADVTALMRWLVGYNLDSLQI